MHFIFSKLSLMSLGIYLLCILVLSEPTLAQDKTYFVSKTGADSNPGSQTQPWLTIGRAAAIMVAGDTVIVGDGTYNEIVRPGANGTATKRITYRAQSLSTIVNSFAVNKAYITIEGFTIIGEGAGLDASVFLTTGGNYLRVVNNTFPSSAVGFSQLYTYAYADNIVGLVAEGNKFLNGWHHAITFSHRNTPRDPATMPTEDWSVIRNNYFSSPNGYDAFRIVSSNIKIIGNTIEHWENLTVSSGNLKPGVGYFFKTTTPSADFSNVGAGAPPYLTGEGHPFTATGTTPNNWGGAVLDKTNHPDIIQSFQNGTTGADWPYKSHYVLFEGNRVSDCDGGVQFGNITDDGNYQGIKDWVFRNNVIVRVSNTMNLYAPGFKFYNNTFYRSGFNSGAVIIAGNSNAGISHNTTVYNNIFAECGNPTNTSSGWYGGALATNQLGDYNLVVGTGAGTTKNDTDWKKWGEQNGINGRDPLFVNAAAGDFRLQANSPAIGKAKILSSGIPVFETFNYDINGVPRINSTGDTTWDIGAFESCPNGGCSPNSAAPKAPSNLTAGSN
jgi:Domain of unknown function (DUF5123)/Protein of unknown function (DUF1565)